MEKETKKIKEKVVVEREEIFNYLRDSKWKNSVGLTLNDMVYDIIHLDNKVFLSSRNI